MQNTTGFVQSNFNGVQQYRRRYDKYYFELQDCQHIIYRWLNSNYRPIVYGKDIFTILGFKFEKKSQSFSRTYFTNLENKQLDDSKLRVVARTRPKGECEPSLFFGIMMQDPVLTWLGTAMNWDLHAVKSQSLDNYPFIKTTPDGVIVDGIVNHKYVLVELKLHFNGKIPKNISVQDYIQCMAEMACSNVPVLLFINYIPQGMVIRLVNFDSILWNQHILPKVLQNCPLIGQQSGSTVSNDKLDKEYIEQLELTISSSIKLNTRMLCHYFTNPSNLEQYVSNQLYWYCDPAQVFKRQVNNNVLIKGFDGSLFYCSFSVIPICSFCDSNCQL